MAFDKKLLEIIACPVSKGKLVYDEKNNTLVCRINRLSYPIRDNIPVLLESEAKQLTQEELEQVPTY